LKGKNYFIKQLTLERCRQRETDI